MKNKKIKGVVTTLALAGSLYAASASALPIATNWSYTIDSGFTAYTNETGGTGGITPSDFNTNLPGSPPTHLQWGTPDASGGNQQSAFRVGNTLTPVPGSFSGTITTNAAPVNTVKMIHDNFPVSGSLLSTATLFDKIVLTETAPGSGTKSPDPLVFNINFLETDNTVACVVTTSPIPCNDIFVLNVAGTVFAADKSITQDFDYKGDTYSAKIFIEGVDLLASAVCNAAGAADGCLGFTTVENQTNEFQVALQIIAKEDGDNGKVPEPSALLLFGAGLCAMGWMKSRRRQA